MNTEETRKLEDVMILVQKTRKCVGPCSEEDVRRAEGKLGVRFPDSYRLCLLRLGGAWGAGGDLLGVCPGYAEGKGGSDVVHEGHD